MMMDMTSFSVGLVAGLSLGGLLAGLWAVSRLRTQVAVAEEPTYPAWKDGSEFKARREAQLKETGS